jgi:hypothetical protein
MSKEAMKLALGKIKSARDCHPNAVNTLLFEAEEILEEALEKPDFWEGYVPEPVKPAQDVTLIDEGKTVQQALDKKAENARELGLDYEPVCNKDPQGCWNVRCQLGKKCKNTPAQQEPVATDWERIARVQDAKLRAMCNESGGFEKLCEVMDRYEHTSPQPAQQEPVAFLVDGDLYYPEEIDWETLQEQGHTVASLYTQAQRTWQGLTDEAIWLEYQRIWPFHPAEEPTLAKAIIKFARAIEAAHGIKEKNT